MFILKNNFKNMTRVGLKELRQNVDKYIREVKRGNSLIVMRKTVPVFKLSPVNEGDWEEVIDFTKIRKGGVDIKEVLSRL